MDTKAIEYFYIPNDTLSYPLYSIEGAPAFYDGMDIVRLSYLANPHTLYRLQLTPTAGL